MDHSGGGIGEELDVVDEPEDPRAELEPEVVRPLIGKDRAGLGEHELPEPFEGGPSGAGERQRGDGGLQCCVLAADAVWGIRAGWKAIADGTGGGGGAHAGGDAEAHRQQGGDGKKKPTAVHGFIRSTSPPACIRQIDRIGQALSWISSRRAPPKSRSTKFVV